MDRERTAFVIVVLVTATVLVALGHLGGDAWVKLVLVLAGVIAHSAALAAPAPEATP